MLLQIDNKYPPKIEIKAVQKILNIPKNPSKKFTHLTLPKKMENISFNILKCFNRSTACTPPTKTEKRYTQKKSLPIPKHPSCYAPKNQPPPSSQKNKR